jgi:hypothetical protein
MATYPRDSRFPPTKGDVGNGRERFRQLDFHELLEVVSLAHNKYYTAEWDKKTTLDYLKSNGLNERVMEDLDDHKCLMEMWSKINELDEDARQELTTWRELFPDFFEPYSGPPVWKSGVTILQLVLASMHLNGEGYTKTVINEELNRWLLKENFGTMFETVTAGLLEEVASMCISWCTPVSFSKQNMGTGWTASDRLAFCRICPWVYQVLDKLARKAPMELPPYDPQNPNCWNHEQRKQWLGSIGRSKKGKTDDVKKRVHELKTRPEGPPQVTQDRPSAKKTMLLVESMFALLSRLMTKTVDEETIHDIHCHSLIFLSYYHRWDQELLTSVYGANHRLYPSWTRKTNFWDLMRLPDYLALVGALMLCWEGDWTGEKFIAIMKCLCCRGQREHWYMHAATAHLIKSALNWLYGLEEMQQLYKDKEREVERAPKRCVPYKNLEDIMIKYTERKPISGFVTKQGVFGICVTGRRVGRVTPRKYITMERKQYCKKKISMAYHMWELHDHLLHELTETTIDCCVLFLPLLGADGFSDDQQDTGCYTVITEDWRVFDEDCHFVYPKVGMWPDLEGG